MTFSTGVDNAVLIGDSVTPAVEPEVELRIRYRDHCTPWWRQRNIAYGEVARLVEGTDWTVNRHLRDGADHSVRL